MIPWPAHSMFTATLYSTHCPTHAVNRRPSPNHLIHSSNRIDNRYFLTPFPNQEESHVPKRSCFATRPVSRRAFLKTAGAGAAFAALSACAAPVAAPAEGTGGEETMAEPQELNIVYWPTAMTSSRA